MLRSKEFQGLKEAVQLHLLHNDAVLLMTRKTTRLNIELYSLYDFYIEVFFDKRDEDPLYIKSFQDEKKIDIYLDSIIIKEIERAT